MAVFSEIRSQDISSQGFPPKTQLLIGRPASSANKRHCLLTDNSLNSCPDSDLRKNLTLVTSKILFALFYYFKVARFTKIISPSWEILDLVNLLHMD